MNTVLIVLNAKNPITAPFGPPWKGTCVSPEFATRPLIAEADLVFWLDDPENGTQAEEVKRINPRCMLVSLAYTRGRPDQDIVDLALKRKSNLIIQAADGVLGVYRLLDPLGNVFMDWTPDMGALYARAAVRLAELRAYTRSKSLQVGERIEAPEDAEFYRIVRNLAARFDSLIPKPTHTSRSLGNASFRSSTPEPDPPQTQDGSALKHEIPDRFRCQRGFPSFRRDGLIFVSRRNTDKTCIDKDGFVAVNPGQVPVEYYGEIQPSVDTPIQVRLYEFYKNVKYMIHGHVYAGIAGQMNPDRCRYADPGFVPCGALEEFTAIQKAFPDPEMSDFVVNLRGHGSIVLAEDLPFFYHVEHFPRPFPERAG